MISAQFPENESERLTFLRQLGILDTAAEKVFDDLTLLASHICGTPIALVSLVDANRQWFKSRVGLNVPETPRDVSFCAHAILQDDTFIVTDALNDERFADNPIVQADPKVRFYAGMPLRMSNGHVLGTLCVIDHEPHDLNPDQLNALKILGREVVAHLEIRQLNSALARSEERLKLATQATKIGVWDWDILKNDLIWDESMYQLYGFQKAGFTGAYDAWTQCVHPDDLEYTDGEVQAAVLGEKEYSIEFRIIHPDGAIRHIQAVGKTFRDADDNAVRMIGTNLDISAQKQAATEILELNARLERRVKERTSELETANRELVLAREQAEAASQAKSAFLATMSHELRTPLNGVLGMAELLSQAPLSDKHREWLDTLKNSGRHLLQLLNDVLHFSSIDSGHLHLSEKPLRLDLLVESILSALHAEAEAKGNDLQCKLAPGTSTEIIGDIGRLKLILTHLVDNAVKFTEQGSIEVTVAPEPENTSAHSTARSKFHFTIKDSGIGIAAEDLETLLHPFVQADSSYTRSFGGAGLGLAICDRLIRHMGGQLKAESTPGQGGTFHFVLEFPIVTE